MGWPAWCIARADPVGSIPDQAAAVVRTVRQEPARHGIACSRWRLADLAQVVPALAAYSRGGLSKLLRRLGIRLKRGRLRLHSPDRAYADKVARIARALAAAHRFPDRCTLVYGDEMSVYRQPTLAARYYPIGEEPTVPLSHRSNTRHRVCGGLDAVTGRVTWRTGSKLGVAKLTAFLHALRATYPGRVLFLVWDNWPVHRHPTVLATAQALHIHLLWLPTYAPWENPIEQLWRWLKQTVLHQHRHADDWEALKQAVTTFLDQFQHGSSALLRYVGLIPK
jgi:transposase